MRTLALLAGLVLATPAFAQVGTKDNAYLRQECRFTASKLIGLNKRQLRERCGIWRHINATHTRYGLREQVVYDRYLYVYLEDDVVTSVQTR